MKKINKKLIVSIIACGLIASIGVGATSAYLTDGETTTNTFTVGKVMVDLTEPKFTPSDATPRVPNEEIPKDPTVANTGENDEVVFVSFDIPMSDVKLAAYDGTALPSELVELFDYSAEDGTYDSANDGWVLLNDPAQVTDGSQIYKTYVYGYQYVVSPDEKTPAVFDKVRLVNLIEGQLEGDSLQIPVRAYAIQSDYLQSEDNTTQNYDITVEKGKPIAEDDLKKIFQLFATQNDTVDENGVYAPYKNADGTAKTADDNNALDQSGNER